MQERTRIESGGEIAEKQKPAAGSGVAGYANTLVPALLKRWAKSKLTAHDCREIDTLNSAIRSKKHALTDNQREIERLEARMEQLRAKWELENSKTFNLHKTTLAPPVARRFRLSSWRLPGKHFPISTWPRHASSKKSPSRVKTTEPGRGAGSTKCRSGERG